MEENVNVRVRHDNIMDIEYQLLQAYVRMLKQSLPHTHHLQNGLHRRLDIRALSDEIRTLSLTFE